MDADSYIQRLVVSNSLRESTLRQMVRWLDLPAGSSGLDAGCGVGLQCLNLAEAVRHDGHVTGLDMMREMLDYGREMVENAGLTDRISFREGDIANLPFDNNTFDWTWSVDCVGYGPWDTKKMLQELICVIKPGGVLSIAAYSSEKLLPGYPRLEARLGATSSGIAPFIHGEDPSWHLHRAMGWFREMGLKECRADAFAGSAFAPLDDNVRQALKELIEMRWPDVAYELSSDDLAEYRRLCLPDSPDFILNLPDYFALFTYTMFRGRKTD